MYVCVRWMGRLGDVGMEIFSLVISLEVGDDAWRYENTAELRSSQGKYNSLSWCIVKFEQVIALYFSNKIENSLHSDYVILVRSNTLSFSQELT
mmetsp:Transcript_31967/g.77279  ORF Transcript_31967/g.77279 Transcript_31967/m.77279 type:complete len:94 (+) Transcript_31967:364-645(+)